MTVMEAVFVLLYVFCYFVFGISGAKRFVDNKLAALFQAPEKRWLRYVAIGIAAFVFAFIEFARFIILGFLKIISLVTEGW